MDDLDDFRYENNIASTPHHVPFCSAYVGVHLPDFPAFMTDVLVYLSMSRMEKKSLVQLTDSLIWIDQLVMPELVRSINQKLPDKSIAAATYIYFTNIRQNLITSFDFALMCSILASLSIHIPLSARNKQVHQNFVYRVLEYSRAEVLRSQINRLRMLRLACSLPDENVRASLVASLEFDMDAIRNMQTIASTAIPNMVLAL